MVEAARCLYLLITFIIIIIVITTEASCLVPVSWSPGRAQPGVAQFPSVSAQSQAGSGGGNISSHDSPHTAAPQSQAVPHQQQQQ